VATVVRPALARGAVVISDRYVDSSLAYQGAGRGLPVEEVAWLSAWATRQLKPDVVVLLDVPAEVGLTRVTGRGNGVDRLERESLAFHERVRHAFLDLAAEDPRRYLVLDGTRPPEEIAEAVLGRVAPMLPQTATPPSPPARTLNGDLQRHHRREPADRDRHQLKGHDRPGGARLRS
jgi:dTMP kinase